MTANRMPTAASNRRRRRSGALTLCCALLALALAAGAYGAEPATETQPGTATEPSAAVAPPAPAAEPEVVAAARPARLIEARARPGRAYYYGLKQIRFFVTIASKAPVDLRIDIVRQGSGALERSIVAPDVQPRVPTAIAWDGLSSAGAPVRGKLRFLVRGAAGQPIPTARRLAARSRKGKRAKPKINFGLFDHIFPVRGKHSYGDGLGAGRGHQGQDVPAACGTRLFAAQGGTVQVNAYQAGGAGYYVVIDTIGSDVDHVYMHLIAPPALVPGQVVYTGQVFGAVGSTGRSTGCHLHFEMWSGPGWYEGGSVMDPAPYLQAWDRYS